MRLRPASLGSQLLLTLGFAEVQAAEVEVALVNSLLSDCRVFYMCSLHDAPWAPSLFEAAVQEKPWAPGTRDF